MKDLGLLFLILADFALIAVVGCILAERLVGLRQSRETRALRVWLGIEGRDW